MNGPVRLRKAALLPWGVSERAIRALVFHSEDDRETFPATLGEDVPRPINPQENPLAGFVLVDQRSRAEVRFDRRQARPLVLRCREVIAGVEEVQRLLGEEALPDREWRSRAPAYPLKLRSE